MIGASVPRDLAIAVAIGNSTLRMALMRGTDVVRRAAVPHAAVGAEVIHAELQRVITGAEMRTNAEGSSGAETISRAESPTGREAAERAGGGSAESSARPLRAGICSVVPELTPRIADMLAEEGFEEVRACRPVAADWFPSSYRTMETLGADRFCVVLAARELHGAPVIVIDCGTATTMNVIDPDGRFLGGSIAPGVEASFRALHDRTAQLPAIGAEDGAVTGDAHTEAAATEGTVTEGTVMERTATRLIGEDTVASMRSGVLHFSRFALEGAVAEVKSITGPGTPVICTGGALPLLLAAGLNFPGMRRDDDILLRGIIFCLHYTG